MKIVSLNARGIGTKDKRKWIKEICLSENPCLIGLQETKLKSISEGLVRSMWAMITSGSQRWML